MLIDVPVLISFNADDARQAANGRRGCVFNRTFTMRFDPEDSTVLALYATVYPPKPETKFWPDTAGILFDLMPADATDARFLKLANERPEDYFVDEEAAKIRSKEIEQERGDQ